ncbi:MAG: BON domain-containing protein [Deltaproteobacteria bacterium]|nr:BON domain-containing protein [Deltaproteobacteria bacterium]
MIGKSKLRSAALAVSVSLALTLSAFAQGQNTGSKSPSPGGVPSSEETATQQPSEQALKGMKDQAATEADRMLNQRIRQALTGDRTLAALIQKIHIDTANGEVTLHGSVATDKQKADLAAKVQQVAGVKKVENQLQTASN